MRINQSAKKFIPNYKKPVVKQSPLSVNQQIKLPLPQMPEYMDGTIDIPKDCWTLFQMINFNPSVYYTIDFRVFGDRYKNMFKLYSLLMNEYLNNRFSDKQMYKFIWDYIVHICYTICIKNELYIEGFDKGSNIISWSMVNITEFRKGFYHDFSKWYLNELGYPIPNIGYVYNRQNPKQATKDFFYKLVQLGEPICDTKERKEFQPFPKVDLSFLN